MRFARFLTATTILVLLLTTCSCASLDPLKKAWGKFLALGRGLEEDAEMAFRNEVSTHAPSLGPSTSRTQYDEASASASAARYPGQVVGSNFQSDREHFKQAERAAAAKLSINAIFSMDTIRSRWKIYKNKRTLNYILDADEQNSVLAYIKTRMLYQMMNAREHADLVSKVRFEANSHDLPGIYWQQASRMNSAFMDMSTSPTWVELRTRKERLFDLGALRIRMVKLEPTSDNVNVEDNVVVRTWLVIARPLQEAIEFSTGRIDAAEIDRPGKDGQHILRVFVGVLRIPEKLAPGDARNNRQVQLPHLRA